MAEARSAETLPDVPYLRERISYDPDTGVCTWKTHRYRTGKAIGTKRYTKSSGNPESIDTKIDGVGYRLHRVIWAIQTGGWPDSVVDHKNHDPFDNRWNNLRLASQTQSSVNTRGYSKSGFKGVYSKIHRGKTQIFSIVIGNGQRRYLGVFATVEAAHEAYVKAVSAIHGEYACAQHFRASAT